MLKTLITIMNFIGIKRIFLEKTESTNSYASMLLHQDKAEEGLVISTLFQTRGRGQMTNQWYSNKGKNLLFSFILFPDFLSPDKQFYLSKMVSLAIKDFLSSYVNKISIKWPNDIYVRDKKIAGILIENTIQGNIISNSIIGIGININNEQFPENIPNAISLKNILQKSFNLVTLLNDLLIYLNNRYNELLNGNLLLLDKNYLESLYLLNTMHTFSINNQVMKGRIIGVTENGRLLIESNGQKFDFGFKEISF